MMKRFVQMLKITFVVNEQRVYSRENFLWALSFCLLYGEFKHSPCYIYAKDFLIKVLSSISEFHITDNFHRCRDKFPSILEILCELNVYICDIVT